MSLILSICSQHGINYALTGHHRCRKGWAQFHCPFCSPNKGFHLGLHLEKGYFNCYKCGGHNAFNTLSAFLPSISKKDIWNLLNARPEAPTTSKKLTREVVKNKEQRTTAKSPPNMGALTEKHRKYLERRGFEVDELIKTWDLKATSYDSSPNWKWRIVAPIRDSQNVTQAYLGRAISKSMEPKYFFSPKKDCLTDPKGLVYGIDKALTHAVLIVEGPTDVWRMGPGAVAVMGTAWKTSQLKQFKQFKDIFILFDPGKTEEKQAQSLGHSLALISQANIEILTGFDTDPGDFTQKQVRNIRRAIFNET